MKRILLLAMILPLLVATGCQSRLRRTDWQPTGGQAPRKLTVHHDHGLWLALEPQTHIRPYLDEPLQTLADDGLTTRAVCFVVSPVSWTAAKGFPNEPEREEGILEVVRERTYRYLLRRYKHPVRVRWAFQQSDPLTADARIITIESYVTDIKRGDAIPRYLIGFGLGQARIQIEGEIFEGRERRRIGQFGIRRGHGAYAQNGFNTRVLKDDYVLKYAAEEAVADLTAVLQEYLHGVDIIPRP
jgi:hypothetical protein